MTEKSYLGLEIQGIPNHGRLGKFEFHFGRTGWPEEKSKISSIEITIHQDNGETEVLRWEGEPLRACGGNKGKYFEYPLRGASFFERLRFRLGRIQLRLDQRIRNKVLEDNKS